MIDGLVVGKVSSQLQSRIDANGMPFVFSKIYAANASGENLFVSVIQVPHSRGGSILPIVESLECMTAAIVMTRLHHKKSRPKAASLVMPFLA